MNLQTLKEVKINFDFYSDSTTHCLGYKWLCRRIEELEQLSLNAVIQAKPEKSDHMTEEERKEYNLLVRCGFDCK